MLILIVVGVATAFVAVWAQLRSADQQRQGFATTIREVNKKSDANTALLLKQNKTLQDQNKQLQLQNRQLKCLIELQIHGSSNIKNCEIQTLKEQSDDNATPATNTSAPSSNKSASASKPKPSSQPEQPKQPEPVTVLGVPVCVPLTGLCVR